MKRFLEAAGRIGLIFCVVTTATVVIVVTTLGFGGFLAPARLDAAVRGLRGESAAAAPVKPAVTHAAAPARGSGELRELETLVSLAEARERDLRLQADRIRAESRAGTRTEGEKPAPAAGVTSAAPSAAPAGTSDGRFKANLDVLRNHVPKTAAALMADWETADIVTYLRAMKPFEAADIVGALLAMGRKGETDYAQKAKDVQAALGKQ